MGAVSFLHFRKFGLCMHKSKSGKIGNYRKNIPNIPINDRKYKNVWESDKM